MRRGGAVSDLNRIPAIAGEGTPPKPGFGADYKIVIRAYGQVAEDKREARVIKNVDPNKSLVQMRSGLSGSVKEVSNSQILPQWDLTTCERVLPGKKGIPTEVSVPAGKFAACRFDFEEHGTQIEAYYGNVPFGLLKWIGTSNNRGMPSRTVEELERILN